MPVCICRGYTGTTVCLCVYVYVQMYSTCYTFTCPQAGGTKLPHPKSRHFEQLLKLFEQFGTPDKRRYLFLGGYVDNGPRSLDTICLLFLYKAISGQFLGDDLRGSWRRPQS